MAKSALTTYGEALFQLAIESPDSLSMTEEITELKKILGDNKEFGELMVNPRFSKEEHLSILENTFKGRLSEQLYGFLELLVVKGRYGSLEGILDYFEERMDEHRGIGHAYVKSAIAVDDEMKKRIQEKLLETTKYNSIVVDYEVDPSLIGGMVIRIKDRIVDNSVKTKLESISRDLHKIQV